MNHADYMKIAIQEAGKAEQKGEVPVGAVLVNGDKEILSASHNQPISLSDPTAHAEILVLREAAARIKNYRLLSTVLYVTVEPCVMCMGAIIHARVSTLVFGTKDFKWGAAGSLYNFAQDDRLNHHPQVIGGICQDTCRQLMQNFFKNKRI
ncbi:tRNA adenosine(34) deaminase TadA [bacterium]|nr:tRNA adenosine(34) deaminase TadA [bacterium]